MTSILKRATSPLVASSSAPIWDEVISNQFAEYGADFSAMRPVFVPIDEDTRVLPLVTTEIPAVKEVSFTDPAVVAIWFESYAGAEPIIEFGAFCKGVACCAFVVDESCRDVIREFLELAAIHAGETGTLPALPEAYESSVALVLDQIFENGEPSSWRSLIAFMTGAFWLLSFVQGAEAEKLEVTGANRRVAALDYIIGMLVHYGALAHLPQ